MENQNKEKDVKIPLSSFEKKKLLHKERIEKYLEHRKEFFNTNTSTTGYYDNEGYFTKIYNNDF